MIRITLLIALAIGLLSGCQEKQEKSELPILGKRHVPEGSTDTTYQTIDDFTFVNQDSTVITQDLFEGKIYVADFFFTTCPTICPVMKTQMLRVYEEYKENDQVLLLSHSIDPVHDSVEVLRKYAEKLGIDHSDKWHFVTGPKEEIYEIAQESYMASALEDESAPGGLVHSGAFILIDRKGRIRGHYDGTTEEEVDELISDIKILLEE